MRDMDMIVCRCEEVSLSTLQKTIKDFQCGARELKLRTRAGMGVCGGRTCRHSLNQLFQESNDKIREDQPLKYQPPVRPISFGDFGGKKHV